MNDEHDPELDLQQGPGLDPEQQARVRALLADLGTAPEAASMPPEVAARLEETLAGLVAERRAGQDAPRAETRSNVIPLRRRWARRAAAAAAAVIVVGAGGVAVANLDVFAGTNATSDSAAGGGQSKAESLDDSSSATPPPSQPGGDLPGALRESAPRLTAASFDADVVRLVQGDRYARVPDGTVTNEGKALDRRAPTYAAARGCPGPKVKDRAVKTLVLYDGTPAALVVHPERDGARLVDAWTCAGDRLLNRTQVPVTKDTSGQSSPGNPGLGSPAPTP